MTTTAATTTLGDLAEQRRTLTERHRQLAEERPSLALRAAGGDAEAMTAARHTAEEMATITGRLALLDDAEIEARRLERVGKQQAAQAKEERTAEQIASIRSQLRADLAALEAVLVDLGERVGRIDQLAVRLDGIEVRAPGAPPYRRRYAAVRTIERLRAALACWGPLLPGPQDTRPLGAGDVV